MVAVGVCCFGWGALVASWFWWSRAVRRAAGGVPRAGASRGAPPSHVRLVRPDDAA